MKQSYQYYEDGGSNCDIVRKQLELLPHKKQNVLDSLVFMIVAVAVSFSKLSHLSNVSLV